MLNPNRNLNAIQKGGLPKATGQIPLPGATTAPIAGDGIDRVGQLQEDLGNRLSFLRENRQQLADERAQPGLRTINEQRAVANRQIGIRGSLGERRRQEINTSADLASQEIRSQSFSQQLSSEQGLKQLQDEFTAMFNDMANTDFTQELSGLGEEIDAYMANLGRDLKYGELAAKAQQRTWEMAGRFASELGSIYGKDKPKDGKKK